VSDRLRFVGDHVEYLASGQALTPGEYVDAGDLAPEDKWLRDEGRFLDAPEPTAAERKAAQHEQLVAQAKVLDIDGRTKMSDDELQAAIAEREGEVG
jgi:hypothetical protein